MRKMRRFAAIAAAAAMTACMAVPMTMTSFAAGETTSITVTDTTNKNYDAYQLMTATVDSEAGAYTYEINSDYEGILKEVTGATDADGIMSFIKALGSTTGTTAGTYDEDGKPTNMRAFADEVYKKILAAGMGADASTDDATFSVEQGYYLIAQKPLNSDTDASTSLVMVDTAGDTELEVNVKKALPEFDKQIGDFNDSEGTVSAEWDAEDYEWGEDADHDKYASDAVPFRLIATLPADYDSYQHYTLSFHDDLQKDVFGEVSIKAVYLADASGTKIADIATDDYSKVAGCDATHSTHGDGCDFTVLIEDLTTAAPAATAGNTVVVEYTAPFTSATVVGSAGNWNTGLLEYSNNPYNSGYGESDNTTSKTEEDSVVAFTYTVEIDKIKTGGDALEGAAFTLKKVTEGGTEVTVKEFSVVAGQTTFTFEGLDDGDYILEESKVPAGYNGIDPIKFTVTANHTPEALSELNGTPEVDDAIAFDVALDTGVLAADVENKSGTELPSTGGIGTTIFYVVGGALAAGAGVSLIAKKRMKNED